MELESTGDRTLGGEFVVECEMKNAPPGRWRGEGARGGCCAQKIEVPAMVLQMLAIASPRS